MLKGFHELLTASGIFGVLANFRELISGWPKWCFVVVIALVRPDSGLDINACRSRDGLFLRLKEMGAAGGEGLVFNGFNLVASSIGSFSLEKEQNSIILNIPY
ncbi:hypothetical protein MAN_09792, partial [Metarhizium hybridum]